MWNLQGMILFYSDYCKHCRMLIDTIERLQSKGISLVSIDSFRANNKNIPPQIHSVPALYIMSSKQIIFGKKVFDYLLLPGKGVLTLGVSKASLQEENKGGSLSHPSDPEAFTLMNSNPSSDNFAFIEDDGIDANRNYVWTSINDMEISGNIPSTKNEDQYSTIQTSTRVKKETLDLDEFKARRAEDLNVSINTTITEPPVTTY